MGECVYAFVRIDVQTYACLSVCASEIRTQWIRVALSTIRITKDLSKCNQVAMYRP